MATVLLFITFAAIWLASPAAGGTIELMLAIIVSNAKEFVSKVSALRFRLDFFLGKPFDRASYCSTNHTLKRTPLFSVSDVTAS